MFDKIKYIISYLLSTDHSFKKKIAFLLLTNRSFRFFHSLGIYLTPVHFYTPIPNPYELQKQPQLWSKASDMPGIRMNKEAQLKLMQEVFTKYQPECDFPRQSTGRPYEFYTENYFFGYVSATAMYSMIRHFRPNKIIEVGSGHSTHVIATAACMNAQGGYPVEVTAIEPYPDQALQSGLPGLTQLIPRKIEDVDMRILTDLQANDILSIDTSHAIRLGGDVVHIYLELIPRLASGVIIHIHDIFLPYNYPQSWLQKRFYWNEQYLVQAFLIYNNAFEILWGQKYSETQFSDIYKSVFGDRIDYSENYDSYSLWLRRC